MPAPRRPRVRRGYMPAESEAAHQTAVIQLARFGGWTVWHPPKNRPGKSGQVVPQLGVIAGWPDLALARQLDIEQPGEFMLAELKKEKGKLSPAQVDAIELLRACGVEVHVWRPSDWPAIERRLRRPVA